MPKLDLPETHKYWKNYEDPLIYRIVAFMETVEDWSLDGNQELEAELVKLGDSLDKLTSFNLGKEDLFVKLCAHIKTSRILRILQAIESLSGGSASRVITYAQKMHSNKKDKVSTLFLRRNVAFERLRVLSRVFAPERLSLVLKTLEQDRI
jgi:intracellular multiplication protein IcmW